MKEKIEKILLCEEKSQIQNNISDYFTGKYKKTIRKALLYLENDKYNLTEGSPEWIDNRLRYILYFMVYPSPRSRPQITYILRHLVSIQENSMNKHVSPEELASYYMQ